MGKVRMKLKKILKIVVVVLVLIYVGYIALMVEFEGPIRLDLTNRIQLSPTAQTIELPWYCKWIASYYGQREGYDESGNHYTEYYYELPDVFESAELNCIVCWETEEVIAFMGESRGMDVIDREFPSVCWD